MIKVIKTLSFIFTILGFSFILLSLLSGLGYPSYWIALVNKTNSIDKFSQAALAFLFLSLILYVSSDYFDNYVSEEK